MKKFLYIWTVFFLGWNSMSVVAMKNDIPKEIEIKFIITGGQVKRFFEFLNRETTYLGIHVQVDTYFDTKDKKLTSSKQKLRIREEKKNMGKKVVKTLCFKQRHINNETKKCESVDELEAAFTNNDELLNVFSVLNCNVLFFEKTKEGMIDVEKYLKESEYIAFAKVEKNRALYKYQCFEIAVDELNGLPGAFIEIELKEKGVPVQEGKQKIYEFLKQIGLKSIKEFNNDYLSMVLDPQKIVFDEITLVKSVKK